MKRLLSIVLSWTLAMSPLYPLPMRALANEPATDAAALDRDISDLLKRAMYPDIPRRGRTGAPTPAEIADLQQRMAVRQDELTRTLNATLPGVQDDQAENEAVNNVQRFFENAKKIESVKILTGHRGDPSIWDQLYIIRIALPNLSQQKFVEGVALGGVMKLITSELEEKVHMPMRATLSGLSQNPVIELRLNPDFLEAAERQAMLVRPGIKSSVMFGIHFAIHRLFDSEFDIAKLTAEPITLTKISASWKNRYASLDVKTDEFTLRATLPGVHNRKTALLKAALKAERSLQSRPEFWGLNEEFWRAFGEASGQKDLEVDAEAVQANESLSYASSLRRLVDLWSPGADVQGEWLRILFLAKRLTLRWLVLSNADFSAGLSTEAQAAVAKQIDERAEKFSRLMMDSAEMRSGFELAQPTSNEERRKFARDSFHRALTAASVRLNYVQNQEVNLGYLIGSEQTNLDALKLSPMIKTVVDSLAQAENYVDGYRQYRESLDTILDGYVVPVTVPKAASLDELYRNRKSIRFNAGALREIMQGVYVDALAADPAARTKDISDLLEVGRILKFNVYEQLPAEDQVDGGGLYRARRPTPQNLKVGDSWVSRVFGQNFRAYRDEVKKDLFTNAPILGSRVREEDLLSGTESATWELWEYLARGKLGWTEEQNLIDRQISDALTTLRRNIQTLDAGTATYENAPGDSLKGLSEEIRTIVSRSSQLNFLLSRFTETAGYSAEIRRELLTPGFWEKELETLSNWSNSYINYMLIFMAAGAIGGRVYAIGRAVDVAGTYLASTFGPGFAYFQTMVMGFLGLSIASTAYRGFGSEANRADIVRNYFSCGVARACVNLYSDVTMQEGLRNALQGQILMQLGLVAAFMGGTWLVGRLVTRVLHRLSAAEEAMIARDQSTLGVAPGSVISEKSLLERLLPGAIQRAKAQANAQVAALGEAYATQAYRRLQRLAWREAKRWQAFDRRYKPILDQVGLSSRSAKDPQAVTAALSRLEHLKKTMQIGPSEYVELKGGILSIASSMRPIWKVMSENKSMESFYNYTFDLVVNRSRAEIAGNLSYYNSALSQRLLAAADEFVVAQYARPTLTAGRVTVSADRSRQLTSATRLDRILEAAVLRLDQEPDAISKALQLMTKEAR